MKQAPYNFFTAVALIVGIVVGSGIFFKSDNILIATNGNILLGILIFILAATSIVFGCLSIAELAARTNQPGGVLSYAKEFIHPSMGTGFGWFQTFIYINFGDVRKLRAFSEDLFVLFWPRSDR